MRRNLDRNDLEFGHILAAIAVFAGFAVVASAQDFEFFEKSIRPVLAENCDSCHPPESEATVLPFSSSNATPQRPAFPPFDELRGVN